MPLRIARSKLVARVESHHGLVVVVAPRGFGKSSLFSILHENGSYVRAKGADWLPDGCDVVVDAAVTTPPRSLAAAISEQVPMIIATRNVSELETLLDHTDVLWLRHSDLAFDMDEIAALSEMYFGPQLGPQLAHVLLPATGGWPALVVAHLEALRCSELLPTEVLSRALERANKNETVGQVLRPILRDLTRDEIIQLSTLAFANTFPEESAIAAVGQEFLSHVKTLGLPLLTRADGRLEFFPVVATYLRSQHPPDPTTIKRMIPSLLACDSVMQATRLLIGVGELNEAALLLREMKRRDLETVDPIDFLGVVSMLGAVIDEWPEVQLQQARVLRRMGKVAEAKLIMERDLRSRTPEFDREVEAELCFLLASEGSDAALLERIDLGLADVPLVEYATRATFLTARGSCLAMSDDLEQIYESEASFLLAARQWESLGENHLAARTLRIFASTTLSELGRFFDVRRVLERSMQLVEGQATNRLLVLCLLCRSSSIAGDLDAFITYDAELEGLASGASLDWAKGLVQWSRMHAAAWRGHSNLVEAHHQKALELLTSFRDTRTEAVFLAESADAHARVGLPDKATALLAEAIAHPKWISRLTTTTAVTVAGASGDLRLAQKLVDCALAEGEIPPSLRWRVLLDLGWAAHIQDGSVDPRALDQIEIEADIVGEGIWPRLLRPELWRKQPDPVEPQILEPLQTIWISVLGGFEVRLGDSAVMLPPGHASTLVKLMSVRGGCVPVEVAIDLLWPDASVEMGRRRLKNVLSRLRKDLGERSVVRTDQSIAFGITVRLDVNEFDQRARKTMVLSASHLPEQVASALEALDAYTGAVLPLDLYEDWVEDARIFNQKRAMALLEIVRLHATPELRPWLAETSLRVENLEAGFASP